MIISLRGYRFIDRFSIHENDQTKNKPVFSGETQVKFDLLVIHFGKSAIYKFTSLVSGDFLFRQEYYAQT